MRASASSYVSFRRQVQKQQFVIDLIDPWHSSSHEVLLESRIVSGLLKDFYSLFVWVSMIPWYIFASTEIGSICVNLGKCDSSETNIRNIYNALRIIILMYLFTE